MHATLLAAVSALALLAAPALAGGGGQSGAAGQTGQSSPSGPAPAGGAGAEAGKTEAEARTAGPATRRLRSQSTGTMGGAAQAGGIMSEEEIRDRLKDQGFADVTGLRREGDAYQATAKRGGKPITLRIDPNTGEVTGSE